MKPEIILFWGIYLCLFLEASCNIKKLSSTHIKEFSCGKLYYKTFLMNLQEKILFVGGINKIFKVNLTNVNNSNCDGPIFQPTENEKENCHMRMKTIVECQNHIKVILKIDENTLYICGTNAFRPKNQLINAQTLEPLTTQPKWILVGLAKCPFDPETKSFTIWAKDFTPGNIPTLFYGGVANYAGSDTLLFRDDIYFPENDSKAFSYLRTEQYHHLLLNHARFIGVFDLEKYLYIFFSEHAQEYSHCGKTFYSRVGRLCKSDIGAPVVQREWTTFIKARLNCSIPGEFPFYFNEIQSVFKFPDDNNRFYAIFTTSQLHGFIGSAICSFDVSEINKVFNGKFKVKDKNTCEWTTVPPSKEPKSKPGKCYQKDDIVEDYMYFFIKTHPLMDETVQHNFGRPIFYSKNVIFTHLVVMQVNKYIIHYAGTNYGIIYKIVQWEDTFGVHSNLVSTFIATYPEAINNMEYISEHRSLYVASDSKVLQINLFLCEEHYEICSTCVRDPDCAWNHQTSKCEASDKTNNLVQDVRNGQCNVCNESINWSSISVKLDNFAHLKCEIKSNLNFVPGFWIKETTLLPNNGKYIYTQDYGLLIMKITKDDVGTYKFRVGKKIVCRHTVYVTA